MTTELLNRIIIAVENIGLQLYSITCDLGAENRVLLKSLDMSPEKTWFRKPMDTNREIHVLADIPHMLKLIQNHLIDNDVLRNNGTLINRETLETLLLNNGKELKVHPTFTYKILELTGPERIRVKFAAQISSKRLATLAKKTFPENHTIENFS